MSEQENKPTASEPQAPENTDPAAKVPEGHHNWVTDLYDKVTVPVKVLDIAVIVLVVIIFAVLLLAGR